MFAKLKNLVCLLDQNGHRILKQIVYTERSQLCICSAKIMTVVSYQGKKSRYSHRKGANFPWLHRVSLLTPLSRLSIGISSAWPQEGSQTSGFIRITCRAKTGYCPRVSDSIYQGAALECTFQSSSQVKLMLFVWGSHLENHCIREIHTELGVGFFHGSSIAVLLKH